MKKIIHNQHGVSLIETVAATAIVAIILITIVGALLYGQKMVILSDSKNNEAAQAQELVDNIMTALSKGTIPTEVSLDAENVGNNAGFSYVETRPKQYCLTETTIENKAGYMINVRVYYNNGESFVELKAFAKKFKAGDLI